MIVELNIFLVTDVFTFTSAFMLGLLFLLSKSENKKANLFLGLFLWCIGGEVADVLILSLFQEDFFIIQTSLLTLPFLLLYIHQTINNSTKLSYYLLFIPAIVQNILVYNNYDSEIFKYIEYAFNISIILYLLRILKLHKERVNNYYSNLENLTLKWIRIIIFIFLGFHLLWITEDIIAFKYDYIAQYFASISSILTFFMVFWIGHNGFSQPEIFKQKLFSNLKIQKNFSEEHKNDSISSHKDAITYETICFRIRDEKLFTNAKLNLSSLAQALELNEKEVSRLINQQSKSNFYNYINQFRVDEFKILLQSPKAAQLSTLGLANEAGFNSKSTFYTVFKAIEGVTPKQYELSLNKSE